MSCAESKVEMKPTKPLQLSNLHRFIDDAETRKNLISIELGQHIIALTPEQLKAPITTALWEFHLSAIAGGSEEFDTFMADQAHLLPILITPITESTGTGLQGHPCPECGKVLRRLPSKKENGKFFWACYEHDKPVFLPDVKGKPGTKQPKTKLLQASSPMP
jgi:DNA topoisomerase-3